MVRATTDFYRELTRLAEDNYYYCYYYYYHYYYCDDDDEDDEDDRHTKREERQELMYNKTDPISSSVGLLSLLVGMYWY